MTAVRKYRSAAVGGTFDHLHEGHKDLLRKAFETADVVYIGLTADDFVSRSGKKIDMNFTEREAGLRSYIADEFPGREYFITKLEKRFGPAMFTSKIDAIIVSDETKSRVSEANQKRREKGLPNLEIESVPLRLASDGKRISSTRVRRGEINTEGDVLVKK